MWRTIIICTDIDEETDKNDEDLAYAYRGKYDKLKKIENDMNGEKNEKISHEEEIQNSRKLNDTFVFTPDYIGGVSTMQLEAINKLSSSVDTSSKVTIASYSGVVAGTAYSVFGGKWIIIF